MNYSEGIILVLGHSTERLLKKIDKARKRYKAGKRGAYFMQKYPVRRADVVSILVMEVQWSNLIRIRYSD